MNYATLRSINEKRKEELKINLKERNDYAMNEFIHNNRYKVIKENNEYYLVNNISNNPYTTKDKISLNCANYLHSFLFGYPLRYITNVSCLKDYISTIDSYNITSGIFSNMINILVTKAQETTTLYIIRVDNLEQFLSKKILQGYKILYDAFKAFVIISNKKVVYIVSEYKLKFLPESLTYTFCIPNIEYMEISNFDITELNRLDCFFMGNERLRKLKLTNFDTTNCKSMVQMFAYCTDLKEVNIDIFNTENVFYFQGMFSNCVSIETLDLNTFNMKNARAIDDMFQYCYKLKILKINKWKAPALFTKSKVIEDCVRLPISIREDFLRL